MLDLIELINQYCRLPVTLLSLHHHYCRQSYLTLKHLLTLGLIN